MEKPYYYSYENRYQKVYEAGGYLWGHTPDDDTLTKTLEKWVEDNNLDGKKIIEFACGEGASGVILSQLGCLYHGVDIAPSAIARAKALLKDYPYATFVEFDMVNDQLEEQYDAALDVMGFHMLVCDTDRRKYLQNAFRCLKGKSPILFFRESYQIDAEEIYIESFEQWLDITKADYNNPQSRWIEQNGKKVKVMIPPVPARSKSKLGYINEIQEAGFVVSDFVEMPQNEQCVISASIFANKPK